MRKLIAEKRTTRALSSDAGRGVQEISILTGFVDGNGDARGRPVGVAIDKKGALLVADDVGNAIWRVVPALPKQVLVWP